MLKCSPRNKAKQSFRVHSCYVGGKSWLRNIISKFEMQLSIENIHIPAHIKKCCCKAYVIKEKAEVYRLEKRFVMPEP